MINKRQVLIILTALLSVTFFQCNRNAVVDTLKLGANDPFKNTMVPSQTFDIDAKQDNIVEGENGTIVVCPKGCFENAKGEIVEDKVKIELSEALSLENMLLSNLTTTSKGKQLETGGMIYFNATANGEQLTIRKENPIHIEIPTKEKKPGMMVYKGTRDEEGNMDWLEAGEVDKFLLTVDINILDFLPEGFQLEVERGLPFKNYKTATQTLVDSLYYSFSTETEPASRIKDNIEEVVTNYNETYYDKEKTMQNKTPASNFHTKEPTKIIRYDSAPSEIMHGINPSIIKVIKSEKYQKTLIATKEFETRLKVIFKTCNDKVLETYINNLDKNLYEIDSMAAVLLKNSEYYQDFVRFSQQRLTRVKDFDKYTDLLKGYYEKQLAKVKSELAKVKEKRMNELEEKTNAFKKTTEDYKKLLTKREKYRMETYGFDWTETGWVNIDNGTLPKDWGLHPLEIAVVNGKQFDRVYTYVIYTTIKSLYRLNTNNNEQFYVGSYEDKQMLMPDRKKGIAIVVGYKGEAPSLVIKEFETVSESNFALTLVPSTLEKVKQAVLSYEQYVTENMISLDMEFMAKIYKEEQRQKELKKEYELMNKLFFKVYPCFPVLPAAAVENIIYKQ